MNSTSYINFSAIDYKGEISLSSYALPITPIRFIPDIALTNDTRVVWDFGDGTISRSFSASKIYDFPGLYTVGLVVYDCNNNAMISTVENTITIYDYIPFTFNIRVNGFLITEDGDYAISEDGEYILASIIDVVQLRNGKIEGPFTVFTYYPPYQTNSDIYYQLSGSNSNNYWNIENNKYAHLDNFYTFYDLTYNYAISSYQYVEVEKISSEIFGSYAKVVNGEIVSCSEQDTSGCLVGYTGEKDVYFKDDSLTDSLKISFFFDKTNNITNTGKHNYFNNLGISLSASVVENVDPSDLSVTSNGLDGEGYAITSFNINPSKFFDTDIPFVVKIKDSDWMSVKNFDTILLSSLTVSLSTIGNVEIVTEGGDFLLDEFGNTIYGEGILYLFTDYSLSSLNYSLSSQSHGGSFRGSLKVNSSSAYNMLQNLSINVLGTFVNNLSTQFTLSGSSSYFNVYSPNIYDIYKKNEDFNTSQTLKDLIFQETLLEKPQLFDYFLGGVLGNETSDHEGIGLKTYEKIANFVKNTQDIDTCEYDYINSLSEFVDHNNNGEESYIYPEKIKRLINLASVNKFKLFGESNKFKENFDIKGRSSKEEYGRNIGNKINISTYVISSDTPIVALEKFSNTYTLLNTTQPVSSIGSHTYPLSSYSSDWGWPLVLPSTFNFSDIEKYYLFFDYTVGYDSTQLGGVIDFDNDRTTFQTTYTDDQIYGNDGLFEVMFLDTFYQSLSL